MQHELTLRRTVRFGIPVNELSAQYDDTHSVRPYEPWQAFQRTSAFFELQVTCRGLPDPRTGFLVNISQIDQAVRDHAIPVIESSLASTPALGPDHILSEVAETLRGVLPVPVVCVAWHLSPLLWIEVESPVMSRILMSQKHSFSASHRLYSENLNPEENLKTYGKCSNPNGHGHNYVLEVTARYPISSDGAGQRIAAEAGQAVVEHVIQKFDHKHLNEDVAEFADVIPTVEHIAQVSFDLLKAPLEAVGADLIRVTVWETDKTCCTYPA